MGITFTPYFVLSLLDGLPPVIFWIIGIPVLGVSAICSVWWFIRILRDARWLEFRPRARRGILTGFVLNLAAIIGGAQTEPITWVGMFFAGCFWWSVVALPDDWSEVRAWLIFLVCLLAFASLIGGGIWLGNSPDNVLLPIVLIAIGGGVLLVVMVLYVLFTGRNTTAAAPVPPQPAPPPAVPAAPVSAPTPLAPPPLAAPAPPAPPAYVVCPWCGHTNPANLIYCSNGACLMPLHSGNRFCIRCGVPTPVNARFCPACGSSA